MARIRVKCPECKAVIKVREERMLNERLRCPRCKLGFDPVAMPDRPTTNLDDFNDVELKVSADESRTASSGDSAGSGSRRSSKRSRSGHRGFGSSKSRSSKSETTESALHQRSEAADDDENSGNVAFVLGTLLVVAITAAAVWWFGLLAGAGSGSSVELPSLKSGSDLLVGDSHPPEPDSRPTHGESISLEHIPVVPQVLFHLRPSEIWNSSAGRRELLATLGDLATWFDRFVFEFTGFRPEEMRELTIAVNFGSRTSTPDVAVVARLSNTAADIDELADRIKGQPMEGLSATVYESGDRAFRFPDASTVVAAGRDLAEDLAESVDYPAVPSAQMEALLQQSDRLRHATLMFDVRQLDVHRRTVLMEQLQELADALVFWFGSPAGTVSWSVHLDPRLHIETYVTHTAESSTRQLKRHLDSRLAELPQHFVALAKSMHPATVGRQQIIGRFPAMMEAVQLGTESRTFSSGVHLTTILPKKAAANLAAGATLTWNESAQTGLRPDVARPSKDEAAATTVLQTLQWPVLAEFRREPLEEAMKFIASEIGISLRIDGDALKLAGFTRNMPQTHHLGEVPARQAIEAILTQYEGKMVIVVDEQNHAILLTTESAATESGLPVLETR